MTTDALLLLIAAAAAIARHDHQRAELPAAMSRLAGEIDLLLVELERSGEPWEQHPDFWKG